MLSNAYFLAEFRFDTAENEPTKNLQNSGNFPNFRPAPPSRGLAGVREHAPARGERVVPRVELVEERPEHGPPQLGKLAIFCNC